MGCELAIELICIVLSANLRDSRKSHRIRRDIFLTVGTLIPNEAEGSKSGRSEMMETVTMLNSVLTSPGPIRRFDGQVTSVSDEIMPLDPLLSRHEAEQYVWSALQSMPGVHFSTLIVRRTQNGFCIEGVMDDDGDQSPFDVCRLVRAIAPGCAVVNRLVVRECAEASPNRPR